MPNNLPSTRSYMINISNLPPLEAVHLNKKNRIIEEAYYSQQPGNTSILTIKLWKVG